MSGASEWLVVLDCCAFPFVGVLCKSGVVSLRRPSRGGIESKRCLAVPLSLSYDAHGGV